MSELVRTVDIQHAIIDLQSSVINDLFEMVALYLTYEELDSLPVISKINEAASLKYELDKC